MKTAQELQLPTLAGALSYKDCSRAMGLGAKALKFYPASQLTPAVFARTVERLRRDGTIDASTRLVVAGGMTADTMKAYLQAGAHAFALGIDCKRMVPAQIRSTLASINKSIR
jgi:2-keto-3-deoxy-6-phosphogluconate aldolase